jgi:N-acetyl-alpha-D-glucosaminyl L-malate synthase BshA
MKIGIICHSTCGGSARIAIESGKELSTRGHDVHLFTRKRPFFLSDETEGLVNHTLYERRTEDEHPWLLMKEWPAHEYNSFISLVASVIKQQGIDILHVHYGLPFAFIAEEIKQRLGRDALGTVATLHGTDVAIFAENSGKGEEFARILSSFNALTTVSLSHARLLEKLSRRKWNVHIIPNFVDLSHFSIAVPVPANSSPLFVHVSNFRSVKDLAGTIEIFAEIVRKVEADLLFVGEGEEMAPARAMVEQKGLRQRVKFLGMVYDVPAILRNADFLIISSKYESFCLAALEAMACGVPVIAPLVGGLPEVVMHNKTGFLFPPGNYAAGADYAVKLLSDPRRYREARINSANRAKDFDRREIVGRYERLYRRTTGNDR